MIRGCYFQHKYVPMGLLLIELKVPSWGQIIPNSLNKSWLSISELGYNQSSTGINFHSLANTLPLIFILWKTEDEKIIHGCLMNYAFVLWNSLISENIKKWLTKWAWCANLPRSLRESARMGRVTNDGRYHIVALQWVIIEAFMNVWPVNLDSRFVS